MGTARWPNRAALIDDEGAISYRELRWRAETLASELQRRGVVSGHAVGVLCRNGRGFVQAVFATAMVGADVVLLNTDFRTESLAAALSTHRIETVICDHDSRARRRGRGCHRDRCSGADAREGDSRPKVAKAGRIVLLTSGTTGAPKVCPVSRNAFGIGHRRIDLGSHRASDWITNLGARADVSRPRLRHAGPDLGLGAPCSPAGASTPKPH
jgi:acyl-CoA synthetase (AMP-forming)/AMP-acid ligase II